MTNIQIPIAVRFGTVVQAHRSELGLSQEGLASIAGLHRTYVSLIELGKRTVTIAVFAQLAGAFDMTMTDLMREVEEG